MPIKVGTHTYMAYVNSPTLDTFIITEHYYVHYYDITNSQRYENTMFSWI